MPIEDGVWHTRLWPIEDGVYQNVSLVSLTHKQSFSIRQTTMSSSDGSENVGIALALVLGAGASTGLGAAVVFFPSIVKLASRRVLAGSLGFSAGVMTYVSFVEIFAKAQLSFSDAGHEDNIAYIYSTLCFFSGVVVMMVRELSAGLLYLKYNFSQVRCFLLTIAL